MGDCNECRKKAFGEVEVQKCVNRVQFQPLVVYTKCRNCKHFSTSEVYAEVRKTAGQGKYQGCSNIECGPFHGFAIFSAKLNGCERCMKSFGKNYGESCYHNYKDHGEAMFVGHWYDTPVEQGCPGFDAKSCKNCAMGEVLANNSSVCNTDNRQCQDFYLWSPRSCDACAEQNECPAGQHEDKPCEKWKRKDKLKLKIHGGKAKRDADMMKIVEDMMKRRKRSEIHPWVHPVLPPRIPSIPRVPMISSDLVKLIQRHEAIIEEKNYHIRELERGWTEEKQDHIRHVKELEKTITDLHHEIDQIKASTICPRCGNIIPEQDAKFCPRCGSVIIANDARRKWMDMHELKAEPMKRLISESNLPGSRKWRIDPPVFLIAMFLLVMDTISWYLTFEMWGYYTAAAWLFILDIFLAVVAFPFLRFAFPPTRRGMRVETRKRIYKTNHRETIKGIKDHCKQEIDKENSRYRLKRVMLNGKGESRAMHVTIKSQVTENDIDFRKFLIIKYAHHFSRGQLDEFNKRGFTTIEDLRQFIKTPNIHPYPDFKAIVRQVVDKIVEDEGTFLVDMLQKKPLFHVKKNEDVDDDHE
jgi:hypothetical protein